MTMGWVLRFLKFLWWQSLLFLFGGFLWIFGITPEAMVSFILGENTLCWIRAELPTFLVNYGHWFVLAIGIIITVSSGFFIGKNSHRLKRPVQQTWAERDRLELYEIACRSVGSQPKRVDVEPQLSRLRYLKDAIVDGDLIPVNNTNQPNMGTQVRRESLRKFALSRDHSGFIDFVSLWERLSAKDLPEREKKPFDKEVVKKYSSDMTSKEAIFYIADESEWGADKYDPIMSILGAIMQFDEAAREGRLEVRGRQVDAAQYIVIERDFWRVAGLDYESHLSSTAVAHTERKVAIPNIPEYQGLLVSRKQVEEQWPRREN